MAALSNGIRLLGYLRGVGSRASKLLRNRSSSEQESGTNKDSILIPEKNPILPKSRGRICGENRQGK